MVPVATGRCVLLKLPVFRTLAMSTAALHVCPPLGAEREICSTPSTPVVRQATMYPPIGRVHDGR